MLYPLIQRPYTVLHVEDDSLTRLAYSQSLTKFGYNVHSVSTIAQGREWLINNTPDIVLCDYMLPDGKGSNLYREIQARAIPFVVISGEITTQLSKKLKDMGVKEVLKKSYFNLNALAIVVARFVRAKHVMYEPHPLYPEMVCNIVGNSSESALDTSKLGITNVRNYDSLESLISSSERIVPAALIFREETLPNNSVDETNLSELFPFAAKFLYGSFQSNNSIRMMEKHQIINVLTSDILRDKLESELEFRFKKLDDLSKERDPNLYGIAGFSGSGKSEITRLTLAANPLARLSPSIKIGGILKPFEIPGREHYIPGNMVDILQSDYIKNYLLFQSVKSDTRISQAFFGTFGIWSDPANINLPSTDRYAPYPVNFPDLFNVTLDNIQYHWSANEILDLLHAGYDVIINTKMKKVYDDFMKLMEPQAATNPPSMGVIRNPQDEAVNAAIIRDGGVIPSETSLQESSFVLSANSPNVVDLCNDVTRGPNGSIENYKTTAAKVMVNHILGRR